MQHDNENNMFINEYCTGVLDADGEPKCLHVAMFYRPTNHHTTRNAEVTPIQCNNLLPCYPPPSYESLPPSPPAYESLPPPSYESLSPPPPAYEALPPPTYDSLPPPPPPYSGLACSCNSSSSPRPTLPPISALLSSIPSTPSFPPPSCTRLPPTTTTAPRFSVFHARYYGTNKQDPDQDRHKLYILTSHPITTTAEINPRARGIDLRVTGTRRSLRFRETSGDVPENTRGLRESTLLGSIAAEDLDELVGMCRQAHLDLLARSTASQGRRTTPRPRKSTSGRFLLYTLDTPPPPYSKGPFIKPLTLASPSQEWVAAVIALAESRGLLQRD